MWACRFECNVYIRNLHRYEPDSYTYRSVNNDSISLFWYDSIFIFYVDMPWPRFFGVFRVPSASVSLTVSLSDSLTLWYNINGDNRTGEIDWFSKSDRFSGVYRLHKKTRPGGGCRDWASLWAKSTIVLTFCSSGWLLLANKNGNWKHLRRTETGQCRHSPSTHRLDSLSISTTVKLLLS